MRPWSAVFLVALAAVVAAACGSSRASPPGAPTVAGAPSSPVLANAAAVLSIPTYDGTGQANHPDIVHFPQPWHGYEYWMSFTPYPFDTDTRENPSIAVSNDGVSWRVPGGLRNPLVPAPACDHNSDPDLVFDSRSGQLDLFYTRQQRRERCASVNQNSLLLVRSADGVRWSSPQVVMTWDLDSTPLYLSPSVLYRDGVFHLWLASQDGGTVHARSSDGVNWSPLERVAIAARPWHLDVGYGPAEGSATYVMLFVDSPLAGSKLLAATSADGLAWDVYPVPLLVAGNGWDDERIYRSTFLYDEPGRLRVWYSARSRAGEWHIGYAETGAAPFG